MYAYTNILSGAVLSIAKKISVNQQDFQRNLRLKFFFKNPCQSGKSVAQIS